MNLQSVFKFDLLFSFGGPILNGDWVINHDVWGCSRRKLTWKKRSIKTFVVYAHKRHHITLILITVFFVCVLQKQATPSLYIGSDIAVWWNFATEYICKFDFVQICIEKNATYYRFSNFVLNLSTLVIWFFLVFFFFFYLEYVFEMAQIPPENLFLFSSLSLIFLNRYTIWHIEYSSLWPRHHCYPREIRIKSIHQYNSPPPFI